MEKTMIDAAAIRLELSATPRGSRNDILDRYAKQFNVSKATIYREARKKFGPAKKVKREKEIPQELIDAIGKIKLESIDLAHAGRELSTEECIKLLIERGIDGAEQLQISSVNRRLRECGFRSKERIVRVEAQYSNQMHQLDFSRSEYFQVVKFDTNENDYLLKVSGTVMDYKYEDKKLRTWLCGMTDAYSRIGISRMFVAPGESVLMGLEFVNWVYGREKDANPLQNLPEKLKLDNGVMGKSIPFNEVLDVLHITKELVIPLKKRGIQKQESAWKTLWRRFELPFALRLKKNTIITLAEYNDALQQFSVEWAQRDHPTKNGSRIHVYMSGLQLHEQREVTVDMSVLLCKQYKRRVDNAGLITVDKQKYNVPDDRYIGKMINVSINANGDAVGELVDEYSKPFALKEVKGYVEVGDFEHRQKQSYRGKLQEQMKESKVQSPKSEADTRTPVVSYLKPVVRKQQVTNKFEDVTSAPEYVFPSKLEAIKYVSELIYQRNRSETYEDYREVFEAAFESNLSKGYVDQVWEFLLQQQQAQ